MKLMHLSDLHLGKRLIDVSMIEDQAYILRQILSVIDREKPDVVLIAGDIYDRANPSVEAMQLLNDFCRELAERKQQTMVISGNHDAPERVAYADWILAGSGIHMSPVYGGHIEPLVLTDGIGPVYFYLMPYVHPETVRAFFPEETVANANDAARLVIDEMEADPACRNVILSHQFISGSTVCDSERRMLGTIENVDPSLYDAFDYVALGHIHRPQNIGRPDGTMRYCGTPLCYSRSEIPDGKSITMVELGVKGQVTVSAVPLQPKHGMIHLRGSFDALMSEGPAAGQEEDYYFVTLTDEEDVPNAAARLRERFGKLMEMDYDNARTRNAGFTVDGPGENWEKEKPPLELLCELFRLTHGGQDMSEEAAAFAQAQIRQAGGWNE